MLRLSPIFSIETSPIYKCLFWYNYNYSEADLLIHGTIHTNTRVEYLEPVLIFISYKCKIHCIAVQYMDFFAESTMV